MIKRTRRSSTSVLNDEQIGQRLRVIRRAAGLSQAALAEALGLTFQQIQKYENGTNRIGAGRLEQIGRILNVPIASFFSVDSSIEDGRLPGLGDMTEAAQSTQLMRSFIRIKDPGIRKALIELIGRLGP